MIPKDEYHQALIKNVRPPNWASLTPQERYNLVVIGAGPAGLIAAAIAAGMGARVALIEKNLMGGDCLNVGCVPSKGILRAARAWAEIKNAPDFGVQITGAKYDFGAVMERMRRLQARISYTDSANRYKELGVDVFFGEGRFTGPYTLEVGRQTLQFKKAVICTGARAAVLAIPGLQETGYLTNETVFNLTQRPNRMAVIGAGPIGCEMAQAFARFGAQVFLFEQGKQILPREDPDAAWRVQEQMAIDGVLFFFESHITRVEQRDPEKVLYYEMKGSSQEQVVDEIFVSTGRVPNVEGLGLENRGITCDAQKGIKVNDYLQTTASDIFSAGDVCFPFQFTHAAEAQAQIVIQNALFPHPFGLGYASTNNLIIPWCTYTDPEIAHVGIGEADIKRRGLLVDVFKVNLNEVDRAILDGQENGFARVYVKKGTDQILGATIVAAHAGDLINEITLAMTGGLGLAEIAKTIHPYPTQAEVIKKATNVWRKSTFTEAKKKIVRWMLKWG